MGVGVGGHPGSITSRCWGRNKDRTQESGGNEPRGHMRGPGGTGKTIWRLDRREPGPRTSTLHKFEGD